jgi:hypothetical protein
LEILERLLSGLIEASCNSGAASLGGLGLQVHASRESACSRSLSGADDGQTDVEATTPDGNTLSVRMFATMVRSVGSAMPRQHTDAIFRRSKGKCRRLS